MQSLMEQMNWIEHFNATRFMEVLDLAWLIDSKQTLDPILASLEITTSQKDFEMGFSQLIHLPLYKYGLCWQQTNTTQSTYGNSKSFCIPSKAVGFSNCSNRNPINKDNWNQPDLNRHGVLISEHVSIIASSIDQICIFITNAVKLRSSERLISRLRFCFNWFQACSMFFSLSEQLKCEQKWKHRQLSRYLDPDTFDSQLYVAFYAGFPLQFLFDLQVTKNVYFNERKYSCLWFGQKNHTELNVWNSSNLIKSYI